MTNAAMPVTFKCPPALMERLPAPAKGRSKFIVRTLEEKFAQKKPVEWKPNPPK